MHYGSPSCLGLNMQTLLELLVIEMGLSLQPFTKHYNTCQHWVTPSWLKLERERASRLNIEIQLAPIPLQPPQECNTWIMAEFLRLEYNTEAFDQLNCVRLYQQVIFLLDVMDASRRAIDRRYLDKRPHNNQWFSLIFPKEMLPHSDFRLWKEVLPQI
jgi:hypothetical protein